MNERLGKAILELTTEHGGFFSDLDKVDKRLGGMSEGFKKVGQMIAGAFTLTAVAGAVNKVLDYAGKINDLAEQTGLSTRAIQEMQYAANQTGTSLETFTNAAFKLGTNLAGGSSSVQGAVEKLGLSYMALRSMSPEDQFKTIAGALGGVENAQERNRLAVEIFGKVAKEILPAISQGYDTLANSATVASEAQLESLDRAGDALAALGDQILSLSTTVLGELVIAFQDVGRVMALPFKEAGGVMANLGEAISVLAARSGALPKVLNATAAAAGGLPKPLQDITLSYEEQAAISADLTKKVEAQIATRKREAKAAKEAQDSQEKFAASMKRLDTAEWFVPFKKGVSEATFELEELVVNTDIATGSLTRYKDTVAATSPYAVKAFDAMAGAVENLGNTILGAIQGGGSILQSVGSSLGSALGTDLIENFGTDITGKLGKTLGGAFNAVLPGVGALIGPLMSVVGNKLKGFFGIGINEEVKKANVEIATLREKLLDTYGPLDSLEAKANALGLSFKANWGHQGQAGLEAFTALMKQFEERLAATNTRFGELFTQAGELGIALPDALQRSIQHLIDLGVITGDVAGQFAGLSGQTGVDFEKMQAAAEKYGVDLGSLGTQFQSARLHASALEIINDFELLTMGGADVGGVLSGMKDEINALVNDSIKFGTEIPENMKPWIEELIRTGQLTDANGEKITDLEGMKFGETVATEFEKITSALEEVVASLGQIAAGINGIPSSKTFTVQAQYYDPGPPEGFGDPGGYGAIPMAEGGIGHVSKPTLFLAGEKPGGEDFAFSGVGRRFGGEGFSTAALEAKFDDLHRALVNTIPAMVESAARHGAQTAGRRA